MKSRCKQTPFFIKISLICALEKQVQCKCKLNNFNKLIKLADSIDQHVHLKHLEFKKIILVQNLKKIR